MDSMEYKLDDPGPESDIMTQKYSKNSKIIIAILVSIIILLLIGLITVLIFYLKDKDNKTENSKPEHDSEDEIIIFYNLSYPSNDTIKNSFGEGGPNYNETIGNVNNGSDYNKTDNNIYDLYIPRKAMERKNKYNKIMLSIHGGAWMFGSKSFLEETCKERTKLGYICASMEYNFLSFNKNTPDQNIFRMLDEITAVQETIKLVLKILGFDEEKLEICLYGESSGAHLALLYSYWLQEKSPIPIKFIHNSVAPVTLEFGYWLYYKEEYGPLDRIDPENIERANNSKLIQNNSKFTFNNTILTGMMNLFLGRELFHNLPYMTIFVDGKMDINQANENFTQLLDTVKIAFPINHINSNTLPTLCYYAGKDLDVGIAQYAYLRNKFNESNNNDNLTLIYSKYATHEIPDTVNAEGKKAQKDLDLKLREFTDKYFTKD